MRTFYTLHVHRKAFYTLHVHRKAFYTLHVHRKDGSSQRHVMKGELPTVGDTVPATLAGKKVSAKVGVVTDPTPDLRHHGGVGIEVHADEI
jgi:hypothetical protein